MRILVTGGTGFIGSALCRALCSQGHEVMVFHRPTASLAGLRDLPVARCLGDLTNAVSVEKAVSWGPEVIYHLGAQNTAAPSVQRMMNTNVLGTRYVLQAAKKYWVRRVVLMSSALTMGIPRRISGKFPEENLRNESHPWSGDPNRWAFAYSKVLAEKEAQLASANGIETVIADPFMVIGAGDRYRRSTNFWMKWKARPLRMLCDGGFNILPLQDAVQGLIRLEKYGKAGERYLLCGENISFSRWVGMASEIMGIPKPVLYLGSADIAAFFGGNYFTKAAFSPDTSERNLFKFAGQYYYYDKSRSVLRLHLPPFSSLENAAEQAYRWFLENE